MNIGFTYNMITLEISDPDWPKAKKYWKHLRKQFNNPDNSKQADFINEINYIRFIQRN